MENKTIRDIFDNAYQKTLNSISTGDKITSMMFDPNPVCALIGNDIKIGKLLGKGNYGSVFEIYIPGMGNKKYAIKVVTDKAVMSGPFLYDETFRELGDQTRIKPEKIITFNDLDGKVKLDDKITQMLYIPYFMKSCKLLSPKKYERFDGNGYTEFDKGDYICDNKISEYAISVLAGSMYRSEISINFLDTFYFASCKSPKYRHMEIKQYTFMEQIDSSLRRSIKCLFEKSRDGSNTIYKTDPVASTNALNSCVIQIIHAIYTYQKLYNIVHGDLHDDNVFFEFVKEDAIWKGEKLIEADYYEYKVEGKSIYIPGGRECPFIIKIGDWGLACKYKKPAIVDNETIETGYDQETNGGVKGPWLPNFYNEMYDMYYLIDLIYKANPSNVLVGDMLAWMLDVPPGMPDIIAKTSFIGKTTRPDIKKLGMPKYSKITPRNLLLNKAIMGEFYKSPPPGSKVILLGE